MKRKGRAKAEGLDAAATAATWSLMLWEQTTKALDEERGVGFAENNPEVVAMCMTAGSAFLLARRLGAVVGAVERLE